MIAEPPTQTCHLHTRLEFAIDERAAPPQKKKCVDTIDGAEIDLTFRLPWSTTQMCAVRRSSWALAARNLIPCCWLL